MWTFNLNEYLIVIYDLKWIMKKKEKKKRELGGMSQLYVLRYIYGEVFCYVSENFS